MNETGRIHRKIERTAEELAELKAEREQFCATGRAPRSWPRYTSTTVLTGKATRCAVFASAFRALVYPPSSEQKSL